MRRLGTLLSLIVLLLGAPARPGWAQSGVLTNITSVTPPSALTGTVGTTLLPFDTVYAGHFYTGHNADSHPNVLVKCGSGDSTRVDATVGLGSGFTSWYCVNVAPTTQWVGNGNGPVQTMLVAPLLVSNGVAHTTDPYYYLRLEPPFVDPLLTVPVLRGLHVNLCTGLPPAVQVCDPLHVWSGPSTLQETLVQGVLQIGPVNPSSFQGLGLIGSVRTLALKDPAGNASSLRVYATNTAYVELSQDGVRATGEFNLLSTAGQGWTVKLDGSFVPTQGQDLGVDTSPVGVVKAGRLVLRTSTGAFPGTDIQRGFLGFGPETSAVDWRLTRSAASEATLSSDGATGGATLKIRGTTPLKLPDLADGCLKLVAGVVTTVPC